MELRTSRTLLKNFPFFLCDRLTIGQSTGHVHGKVYMAFSMYGTFIYMLDV